MATFENINIEKGMYQTKGGLTEALEKLDPSENYVGTSLEGLDAFSRQLKRYDIRVSGRGSDCVEKFFQTSNSAALFPEYVSRAVRQGMERADILPNLVATVTDIEGMDYRSIVSAPTDDEKSLKIVGEGAAIPQTTVRTRENLVKLHKRGRMLVASYEALRFQRLDLFTVTLNQIGAYIARAQLHDAVEVLINGDGNGNAASVITPATAGTLTYGDMVKLWANMAPYELNTILAPTAEMQKILALPQMQDSHAGLDFQGTGKMITPMGATLLHVPEMASGRLIGLDKNCALEMVQAGGVVTDYDKLIDRQLPSPGLQALAVQPCDGLRQRFDGAADAHRAAFAEQPFDLARDHGKGVGGKLQPAALVKAVDRLECPEEGLLRQLLGQIGILRKRQGVFVDVLEIAFVNLLELDHVLTTFCS